MSKSRNHDGQGRLAQKSSLQFLPCRKESSHSGHNIRKNGVVRRMFDSISDMQRAQKQTDHSVALLRRNQQILLQRSDSLTVTCQRTSAIVDQLLALFSLKPASVAEGEDALLSVPEMKFESDDLVENTEPRPAKTRRSAFGSDNPVGREMSLNEWSQSVIVKAEPCDHEISTSNPPPPSPPPNLHEIEMRMCAQSESHEIYCRIKEETIEALP